MNICVFGSSSEQIDKIYLESAEHLGKKIAEKGYNLVFGAGKYGIMGASRPGAPPGWQRFRTRKVAARSTVNIRLYRSEKSVH